MIPEKLCMFCNHLEYTRESGGEYSEPPELNCAKGHYKDINWSNRAVYGWDDFRRMIVRAKDCPDYDQAKV